MNEKITKERQPAVTAEVAAELAERQATVAARLTEPPRPGDVYLSRRTADFPVEWLVLDHENGRVRVVPFDDHPFAGSRDLAVPPRTLGGAGVLRCDLDAWIDTADLEPELRTGALTEIEVQRVRRKRRAIDEGTPEASLLEEEVDGDPEYRRWRERTLRPALDALQGVREDEEREVAVADGRRWWPLLLAASVLLALGVTAAWQWSRLSLQLADERTRLAELEHERRTLEEQLADARAGREASAAEVERLETALADAQEAFDAQKERLEDRLGRAVDASVVVNVPSFVLASAERKRAIRGLPEVIDPGGARRFTLSVEVIDPEPYGRYRLRVVEKATGKEIWSNSDLVPLNGKWLRLDLPADLFEAAEYELLIDGLGSGVPKPLDEPYLIRFSRNQ